MTEPETSPSPRGAIRQANEVRKPIDASRFRAVMGRFATGITVITTEIDGEIFGMTANAFMAGSLDPPLCLVSVRKEAMLHERLRISGCYGVSLLSQEQQHLSNHFAGRRLPGLRPEFRRVGDIPVLNRALAVITAQIVSTPDCGDHTLFIGRIAEMASSAGKPLLFYGGRYGRIGSSAVEQIDPPAFW